MSKEKERALAHVERIVAINPIPNYDRVELATVLGWDVIVGKGSHKVGDLVVFLEVDSQLPNDKPLHAAFEPLEKRKKKEQSTCFKDVWRYQSRLYCSTRCIR